MVGGGDGYDIFRWTRHNGDGANSKFKGQNSKVKIQPLRQVGQADRLPGKPEAQPAPTRPCQTTIAPFLIPTQNSKRSLSRQARCLPHPFPILCPLFPNPYPL